MPPRRKVGGIWLDSFCFRHAITLEAIGSPLLTGQMVSPTDLIIALKICSSKDWKTALKPLSIFDKFKFSGIMYDAVEQARVILEFKVYLSESTSGPKTWKKQNNNEVVQEAETPPISESIQAVSTLISKFGFTEEQAWNMAIGKAGWYITAYSISEGAEIQTITTTQEEKEFDDKKRMSEIEKNMLNDIQKMTNKKVIVK